MVRVKTILDILACVISFMGAAPLFFYLDTLPRIGYVFALLTAVFMGKRGIRPLRGISSTLISLVFFIYYAVALSRENILDPTINILIVLLSVRLVSERVPRNYLQIFALSLFALSASSLYSLSPIFIVYLTALILCIAVSLVLLTFFSADSRLTLSRRGMKRLATVAVAMPVAAVPLVFLFFVVMPRPQFPLWNFLAPTGEKKAGLAEKIVPGSSSRVAALKVPVLRARSRKLSTQDLYWRGIVLNTPEGNSWVRTPVEEGAYVREKGAEAVRQTVFVEPDSGSHLVALDIPVNLRGTRVVRLSDMTFIRRSHTGRMRYDTVSYPGANIRVHGGIDRDFYLKLPARISSRVRELGKKLASRGTTDRERLASLEDYFGSARYRYATTGLPRSADPIDQFLFVTKTGHCELFASSFMVLLRAAGVPSRLVGGYHGGEYNEMAGYYLVTEDMAHAWVEVYLTGVGWVRKDPTVFAMNSAEKRKDTAQNLLLGARRLYDSFNYYWNLVVITYDLDKQMSMFRDADSTVKKLTFSLEKQEVLLLLGIVAGLFVVWRVVKSRWGFSVEKRLLRGFFRKIEKSYPRVSQTPSTGLMELAERVSDPSACKFAELYCGCVYRDRRISGAEKKRLRRLLKSVGNHSGDVKKCGKDGTSH